MQEVAATSTSETSAGRSFAPAKARIACACERFASCAPSHAQRVARRLHIIRTLRKLQPERPPMRLAGTARPPARYPPAPRSATIFRRPYRVFKKYRIFAPVETKNL